MRANVIFILASATILLSPSFCYPSQNIQPQNLSSATTNSRSIPSNHQPITSKLDDLAGQRTESIRHIIASEQKTQEQRLTGLSSVSNHGKKVEKSLVDIDEERFPTLEELRAKCQHYARLFGNNDVSERYASTVLPPRSEYYNRPAIEVTRRPVYIRNKPTFFEKNHGGFYVTASSTGNEITTTKRNPYWTSSSAYPSSTYSPNFYSTRYTTSTTSGSTSTTSSTPENVSEQVSTTEKPKIKIRYTKYEPVILQKTILTDGRVLYHWHKSLPTAALDLPAPITPIATPILQTFELPSNVVPAVVPLPTRNFAPVEPMTEPTTTTTTERSSWLFVPFSGLFGGSHDEESSTVESTTATPSTPSTTTTTTTTAATVPGRSTSSDLTTEEVKLQPQLKFVVPINYDEIDKTLAAQNKPWDYNRFDYQESQRGPDPAPQQPNYQVIKTLAIPPTIPRYTLGYAGPGYGLYPNGGPYGGYGNTYGAGYGNYQGYDRDDRKL